LQFFILFKFVVECHFNSVSYILFLRQYELAPSDLQLESVHQFHFMMNLFILWKNQLFSSNHPIWLCMAACWHCISNCTLILTWLQCFINYLLTY